MVIECKKPCKKKKSTMLTVEQMADIALGSPEIGAVNFNVLHALIHVLIQQLNIKNYLVEFKGYDSERMEGILLSAKPGPILKLTEYIIDYGEDGKICTDLKDKEGTKRKRSLDEDKEKEDKEKPESEAEDKKIHSDNKRKKEGKMEKDEETDEYESKKRKETKEGKEGKESKANEEIKEGRESKANEEKNKKGSKDGNEEKEGTEQKKKCCPCKTVKDASTLKNASFADENVKAASSAYYGSETDPPCKTIVRVEPVGDKCDNWRSRPALAHESLVKLEEKVAMLQDAFEALEKMPTNEELKQRAQGGGNPATPVKDLWQTYNLHKRVESCEGAIEKLASMIEDLVKETCKFREAVLVIADAVDDMEYTDVSTRKDCCAALEGRLKPTSFNNAIKQKETVDQGAQNVQNPTPSQINMGTLKNLSYTNTGNAQIPSSAVPGTETNKNVRPSIVTFQDKEQEDSLAVQPTSSATTESDKKDAKSAKHVRPSLESDSKTVDAPHKIPSSEAQEGLTEGSPPANVPTPTTDNHPSKSEERRQSQAPSQAQSQAPSQAQSHAQSHSSKNSGQENLPCNRPLTPSGAPPLLGPEYCKMTASQKFCAIKDNIDWLNCQIRSLTDNLPAGQIGAKLCALVSLQKQLDALEKEWRNFADHLCESGNVEEGQGGIQTAFNNMRSEAQSMSGMINKLVTEKQESDATLKNILLEIQMLKNIKADMDMVEDLLAEKADASAVNRKVSHDQFDAACDDLTRGLDEALDKLLQQEAMWHEALAELQKDLNNKLNKNEIMPLKDFINKKLKCLQEKLKQLAQLRKDAEAAGAKTRILRNLNCIACDGDVVMKMDNLGSFQCPILPPTKSIKPMITYELDQVRRAMKKGPCKASTHAEEAIMDMQKKSAGLPLTQREVVDNKLSRMAHFCNRYCGGSHTITTATQRVTRIGHFLTEFGPQALAIFNQANCESK